VPEYGHIGYFGRDASRVHSACAGEPGVARTLLRDGPLSMPPPHAWAIGQPLGATFTDGLETTSALFVLRARRRCRQGCPALENKGTDEDQ
jgi:hypothetical protein